MDTSSMSPLEAKARARAEARKKQAREKKILEDNKELIDFMKEATRGRPTVDVAQGNEEPEVSSESASSRDAGGGVYEQIRNEARKGQKEAAKGEKMRNNASTAAMARRAQRQRELKALEEGIKANDEAWLALEDGVSSRPITLADVPELPDSILCCDGVPSDESRTARYKTLVKRWHPDKFTQKFSRRLRPQDREEVLARVNSIFSKLNEYKYICDL